MLAKSFPQPMAMDFWVRRVVNLLRKQILLHLRARKQRILHDIRSPSIRTLRIHRLAQEVLVGKLRRRHLQLRILTFLDLWCNLLRLPKLGFANRENIDRGGDIAKFQHRRVVEGEILRLGLLTCRIQERALHVEDLHATTSRARRTILSSRIRHFKRICLSAAQQTARLLHNIEDKKGLVRGFPWWQMISCLICASSILLVASICIDREQEAEEID